MLKTLQTLQTQVEQLTVLSEVIKNLTPQPYELPPPSEAAQKVLREVRKKVNVGAMDKSDRSEAKVLERLGNEMTEIVLKDADLDAIRGRLADRGFLPRSEFTIEMDERVRRNLVDYGVAYDEVVSAVQSPTMVDTLTSPAGSSTRSQVWTFVRKLDDDFSVIVHATRVRATCQINVAWRVSHQDVNISNASDAVDVVRSFTDVYGVLVPPGHEGSMKLILEGYLPAKNIKGLEEAQAWFRSITDENTREWRHFVCIVVPGLTGDVIYMAYAIQIDKYQSDLRRRGILR